MSIRTSLELSWADRLPTDLPVRQAFRVYLRRLAPVGLLVLLTTVSTLLILAVTQGLFARLLALLPLLLATEIGSEAIE